MVNHQNLPRPAPELSEDGVPATEDIPEDVLLTGDVVEGDMPPLDRPQAAEDWGTTTSEQLGSEPLDLRLAREEPEVDMAEVDAEPWDALSPEEAAMRVVEEPPGMNYDPDPGYVDHRSLDSE